MPINLIDTFCWSRVESHMSKTSDACFEHWKTNHTGISKKKKKKNSIYDIAYYSQNNKNAFELVNTLSLAIPFKYFRTK